MSLLFKFKLNINLNEIITFFSLTILTECGKQRAKGKLMCTYNNVQTQGVQFLKLHNDSSKDF